MQVVSFYSLLDNYLITGMGRSKSGVSGVQVYQKYDLYWNISRYNKMSGHHSRYHNNYESQVCHAGCQVIA